MNIDMTNLSSLFSNGQYNKLLNVHKKNFPDDDRDENSIILEYLSSWAENEIEFLEELYADSRDDEDDEE